MPIKFYLESRPNKKGECMIRVSAMIKAHRFLTSLGSGYTISPIKWDTSKQCVKKGSFNSRGLSYAEINNRINSVGSEFQHLESEVLNGRPISKDTLKDLWQDKFCRNPKNRKNAESEYDKFDNSFFGLYDRFMADEGKVRNWRPEIKSKFTFTKSQLQHFNPNLRFEDITKEMLADFCTFLIDKYSLANETVLKKIVDIRQFFRWAIDNQFITSSPIMKFKPKLTTAKRPVIYLEWDELMSVYNLKFAKEQQRHEHIRDCFVFLCFTGMRYSDLQNLKKTDIRGNSIFITTIKTSDALEIQLNKYSKAILDKYKNVKLPKDKALPTYTLTEMNIALKKICEKAEIKTPIKMTTFQGNKRIETVRKKHDLIGTHCGRRTFVCNALMLGIAPDIVMKWTGHKHYSAMKPYIEISNTAKSDAMKLFDKKPTITKPKKSTKKKK